MDIVILTHLGQMEFPSSIIRPVHFRFKDLWIVFLIIFYSNFDLTICKQTVETLIRRNVLWHLILSALFVCLYPIKMTLCLYGLNYNNNGIELKFVRPN